jgi:hypothetical protein
MASAPPPSVLLLSVVLLALAAASPASAQATMNNATAPGNNTSSQAPLPAYANATLPRFSAVRACVPFTLLVQPNKNVTAGSNERGGG